MTIETLIENNPIRSLLNYIEENKKFRIPPYQRGFKWGVTSTENSQGEVHKLISDLIKAFKDDDSSDYFIQGITVCKSDDGVTELIDGQQRTTFFYLLLCYLSNKGKADAKDALAGFEIDYCSRGDSQEFLENLKRNGQVDAELRAFEIKGKCKQDIYYFRKALKTIDDFSSVNDPEFTNLILKRVKLIYTEIHPLQARRVFSMMNQGKAFMKAPELIKASFLSVASRSSQTEDSENESYEWGINEVRSRFAREWNQWEHWWRTEKVKQMFGYDDIEFLLRLYFLNEAGQNSQFNWNLQSLGHANEVEKYNKFKDTLLKNHQKAKLNFQKLRKLQQQMEQLVSNSKIYNYLTLILKVSDSNNIELINYYKDKEWEIIKADVPYFLIKPDIELNDIKKKIDLRYEADNLIQKLNRKYVYDKDVRDENGIPVIGAYQEMCRILLWMNVEEEMNLANTSQSHRYFNFEIWSAKQRTLEHIYPKSKASYLNFSNDTDYNYLTVHSAGNLVLLYQKDNSKFSDKLPSDKKMVYFDFISELKSRHLMHSIMVFAKRDDWREKEIVDNQKVFINRVICLFFESKDNYKDYLKSIKTIPNE